MPTSVTFDADGQHRTADATRLIAALQVLDGARIRDRQPVSGRCRQSAAARRVFWLATVFTRLTTGLRVTDTHNGLRAMTRRGARAIALRQNRMAHASEMFHQIADSGLKFVEVPVTIEYSAYSLAKGQTVGDALVILTDLFARRLHR